MKGERTLVKEKYTTKGSIMPEFNLREDLWSPGSSGSSRDVVGGGRGLRPRASAGRVGVRPRSDIDCFTTRCLIKWTISQKTQARK